MMISLGFQVKGNFSGDLIENLLSAGSLFRDHRWPFPSAVRIFAKPVGTGQGTGMSGGARHAAAERFSGIGNVSEGNVI